MPGTLTVPDQLIDYTWGREHSFSLTAGDQLQHVDFSWPFDEHLRSILIRAAENAEVDVTMRGCVGVAQGPRLETAAEIQRYKQDGCDMIGMTSMPEAALARGADRIVAGVDRAAATAVGVERGKTTRIPE